MKILDDNFCHAVCPKCTTHKIVPHYSYITEEEHPEELQKLFDRSLFKVQCPKCGEIYEWNTCHGFKANDLCNIVLLSEESSACLFLNDFPEFLDISHPRIVFNRDALVEKARLLHFGYDDRAIEILKVMLACKNVRDKEPINFTDIFCWPSEPQGEESYLEFRYRLGDKIVKTEIMKFSEYLEHWLFFYDYLADVHSNEKNVYFDFEWATEFMKKHLSHLILL